MDFNFPSTVFEHLLWETGNASAFTHEAEMMAKSAITANNYNPTVTFIVGRQRTGMRRIKKYAGVHTPSLKEQRAAI